MRMYMNVWKKKQVGHEGNGQLLVLNTGKISKEKTNKL
jgi:hypothetical protein